METLNRKLIAAVLGAALFGGMVLPAATATAAVRPAAAPASAESTAGVGNGVDVFTNIVDITASIYQIITDAVEQKLNRPGYVKSLMEGTFHRVDEKYNVMIINTGNKYHTENMQGVVYDAVAHRKGYPDFHIYVFESGKFVNPGPFGWENWAMVGVFDRPDNGGAVTFHKFN